MARNDCGSQKETMKKRDVLFAIVAVISISAALFSHLRRRKVEAFLCGSQMSSIALAEENWAEENHTTLPGNFAFLSSRFSTRTLICPIDRFHELAKGWDSFTSDNASYELLTPGVPSNNTNALLRCPYHDYAAFANGTVFDGKLWKTKAFFDQ
jgi:hypothetical protein